jgi:transposase-like protein
MPKPGPRTTYKYSDEFKATAVRLSQLGGVAVQDLAEALYIHPFMLSRWRKNNRGQNTDSSNISDNCVLTPVLLTTPCTRTGISLRFIPAGDGQR